MRKSPGISGRALFVAITVISCAAAQCLADGVAAFTRQDYKTGSKPNKILTADFNTDGITDIATLNSATFSILYGQGAGVFAKYKLYSSGKWPADFVTGDFNSDAKLDVAVLNYYGIRVICATPQGKFKRKTGLVTKYAANGLASGDFNQDGFLDFAGGQIIFWGGPWGIEHHAVFVTVFDGKGDGLFSYRRRCQVPHWPTVILNNDFDGNGLPDLAVANAASGGKLGVFYGQPGGDFGDRVDYACPGTYAMTSADLNGDTLVDIALVQATGDAVAVLYGQEGGGFGAAETYPVTNVHSCITTGDFNGDGRLDIATCTGEGRKEGFVTVLYAQDGGGFGQQTDYPVGKYPRGITAADFNGDGLLDIAATNNLSKTVSVLLNAGNLP